MEIQILYDTIREINMHIAVLNDEMGHIQIDVAILKTQMTELIWWFRGISAAFLVLIIGKAWKTILSIKNGK